MPVVGTSDAGGGMKTVRFGVSPKMSSYLVYFGAGDFERIHRDVGGVDVGVIFKRGESAKAQYALDVAAKVLPFYNDYFGVPYPLPKLDLIAAPGQSQFFCAMENWGAILYFERAVLIDPKITTEGGKQQVFNTIAHEMAHQWSGDLVTMAWWDDLWLNEGFASWMAAKATDHFNPTWNERVQELGGKQGAMRLDAQAGTHPIVHADPGRARSQPGLRHHHLPEGRGGHHHAGGLCRPRRVAHGDAQLHAAPQIFERHDDDLWKEVDAVSPKKITKIAHDFTLQSGVPLIRVEPTAGGLKLTQERFGVDEASKQPRTWTVPVTVGPATGGASTTTTVTGGAPVTVAAQGATLVNKGQDGYFRTAYAPAAFKGLVEAFPTLAPADQTGLLSDSWALGEAGYVPVSEALDLTLRVPSSADPIVLSDQAGGRRGRHELFRRRRSGAGGRQRLCPPRPSADLSAARLGREARRSLQRRPASQTRCSSPSARWATRR